MAASGSGDHVVAFYENDDRISGLVVDLFGPALQSGGAALGQFEARVLADLFKAGQSNISSLWLLGKGQKSAEFRLRDPTQRVGNAPARFREDRRKGIH